MGAGREAPHVAGPRPQADAQETDEAGATSTVSVQRRDLVESESFSGTLGYGDERTVSGGLSGALTWIAGEGATRSRNEILYMVDESPVVLMYGTVPAYRDMTSGDQGRDVLQLERNLEAMGYTDDGELVVDGTFDSHTTGAVTAWQADLGLDETGTVERGRVVFLPGERRVSAVKAALGGAGGGAVMSTTSSQRSVTVDLDARRQDLVSVGDTVSVDLPDGATAEAKITSVGRVATETSDGGNPTISVILTVTGSAAKDLADAAPVTVNVQTDAAEDVLAVPVNALLALAGGGFGLERVNGDGTSTIVSATVGTTADGYAAVEGPNVEEGMDVVVPA